MGELFWENLKNRKFIFAFLGFYLLFCFATYRHFGVTWDEFDTYISAGQWLRYYLGLPNRLSALDLNFVKECQTHNCFNTAVVRILTFSKTILPDRIHLVNLLLGIPLFWFAYELMWSCFKNGRLALIGPIVMFMTPRLLGDLPANPKDAPLAVVYFASLAAMVLRREWVDSKFLQSVLLGVFFGLTISYRIIGFTLFPIYVAFRIYEECIADKTVTKENCGKWLGKEMVHFLIIFLVSQFLLCLLWPFIGQDYFHHIWMVFSASGNLGWDNKILFMGRWYQPSNHFLWYYLPVWILIATPIFILGFSFFSLLRFKALLQHKAYFLVAFALVFNLAFYFLMKPEIFNGLRHYLFVVPMVSFLSCFGLVDFFQTTRWKPALFIIGILLAANVMSVTTDMIRLFPYDYVYFNEFVGGVKGADGKFETDYWGASLREASEWLRGYLKTNPDRTYKIKMTCSPWQQQIYFFPNMKGDAHFTEKEADYWLAVKGVVNNDIPAGGVVIHSVEREGVAFSYVAQMKNKKQGLP